MSIIKKLLVITAVAVSTISAFDSDDMLKISLGDTKETILKICGKPSDAACRWGQECWSYWDNCGLGGCNDQYLIVFEKGIVIEYGPAAAWDNSEKVKVTVDGNINHFIYER